MANPPRDKLRPAPIKVLTDHEGHYKATGLAPGKYWILAREIGDREAAAKDQPIEPRTGAQPIEPRTGAQPLARDAGGRLSLRFEGEALKKTLDLTPCQRVSDYALPIRSLERSIKAAGQVRAPSTLKFSRIILIKLVKIVRLPDDFPAR